MKTLAAIGFFLLSLLFLLQAGMSWVLVIQKEKQRKEIRQHLFEGLLSDELIFLEIPLKLENEPNNQFIRIHDKEFEYMGQMYDIVREERVGESTWYEVFPDKKETKLKLFLKQLVQDETRRQGPLPVERFAGQLLSLFYVDVQQLIFTKTDTLKAQNPAVYLFAVKVFFPSIPERPPRDLLKGIF